MTNSIPYTPEQKELLARMNQHATIELYKEHFLELTKAFERSKKYKAMTQPQRESHLVKCFYMFRFFDEISQKYKR